MERKLSAMLATIVATLAITLLTAAGAGAAPQLLDSNVTPGATIDKADGPITIAGSASGDTARVLVAIRNNANNRWWSPASCSGITDCDAGTLRPRWTRSPAATTNAGNQITYEFPADLPVGNYQLGVRPVSANGTVLPGTWFPFRVINSRPYERAFASPGPNTEVSEGLVTITSGHPFGSPIFDGPGEARIALKRLSDNRWLRANGTFQFGYHVQGFGIEADGAYSFLAREKVQLAPGRYGYWIEHYDQEGVKDSTAWSTFTVKPCSNRCANITATVSLSPSAEGLCYSIESNLFSDGGNVMLAIKRQATGQWLQSSANGYVDPNSPTFGSWKLFNADLGQFIQSDPDVGYSCISSDPLALPSGVYFMGVNPVDTAGNFGAGQWLRFTIP